MLTQSVELAAHSDSGLALFLLQQGYTVLCGRYLFEPSSLAVAAQGTTHQAAT